MSWQIHKRRGGAFRRMATRGKQYDGSRWELHGSYKQEGDARKALAVLERKASLGGGLKRVQYKLIEK